MEEKLRELALTNALTDAYLVLEDCRRLWSLLNMELQAARDDRRDRHKEWADFMAELRETLAKIQTRFRIDAMILGLVQPSTGEQKCHGKENASSRYRMLDGFAKSGS